MSSAFEAATAAVTHPSGELVRQKVVDDVGNLARARKVDCVPGAGDVVEAFAGGQPLRELAAMFDCDGDIVGPMNDEGGTGQAAKLCGQIITSHE
ncbi:hypothetical protein CEE94_12320, partial [Lactobacillus crispatus]